MKEAIDARQHVRGAITGQLDELGREIVYRMTPGNSHRAGNVRVEI
jgi:hypothetical protein